MLWTAFFEVTNKLREARPFVTDDAPFESHPALQAHPRSRRSADSGDTDKKRRAPRTFLDPNKEKDMKAAHELPRGGIPETALLESSHHR